MLKRGLTHDGAVPAFVSCNGLDHLPHIFGIVGAEVSLLMSLPCFLEASIREI